MPVVLLEPGLQALLDSQTGPVGLFVARIGAEVTEKARANVRDYFHTAPSLTVDQDVGFDMEGSSARVGIRDGGSKSRRLAQAQQDGTVNWLTRALEDARRP
jgi:hypothetical protein